MTRERSWWGWGFEDQQPDTDGIRASAELLRTHLGFGGDEIEDPVPLDQIRLRPVRLRVPDRLAPICSTAHRDRVRYSHGQAFRDVVRALRGQLDEPTDVIARPRSEQEVEEVLAWADAAGAAVIPYGGGTSVVGGVEPRSLSTRHNGAITLDTGRLNQLMEVDATSLAARIQAGASGPELEQSLRPHGLTMRFYPQSFELSTLGGWIATRAAGHYATGPTHIDDLVESVRAVSPAGIWNSRRLPASGAGPSPDRLLLGSEGALAVITEAWMRVRPRPRCRSSAAVWFSSMAQSVDALRELAQSGLQPTNCRLLDPAEAHRFAGGDGERSVILLGFESFDEPVGHLLRRSVARLRRHGGLIDDSDIAIDDSGAWDDPHGHPAPACASGTVRGWRSAFLAMPYLRDAALRAGVIAETFETAATWDHLRPLNEAVREALLGVASTAKITMRITHAYPDGAAPYFTVAVAARRHEELAQWDTIKTAVSDAIIAHGGTITHHHAVGRDHRVAYDRQRPELFAAGLAAVKSAVDPAGCLNPGVLIG